MYKTFTRNYTPKRKSTPLQSTHFLPFETEFLDETGVRLGVMFLEILQVLAAICYHLKKSAT